VEAAITLAALPVASVVLWTLLRSPSLGGRLVAVPTGARWHDHVTPLFGGVGIAAGLLAGIVLALATGALDASWLLAGIVGGCGLVFAAGLLDDVRHLSPLAKLAAQIGAACLAIAAGLRV
jgi:UDP-N-acetylmuramyl pentapeptide phosphotransferase/UDP-N-acetylglucosamine-1-phosphate transferase